MIATLVFWTFLIAGLTLVGGMLRDGFAREPGEKRAKRVAQRTRIRRDSAHESRPASRSQEACPLCGSTA